MSLKNFSFNIFFLLFSLHTFSNEGPLHCSDLQNKIVQCHDEITKLKKDKKLKNKYRINLSLGIDTPGEGTRLEQGILFKAFLSGGHRLKYSASFGLISASQYIQGEFSLGGQFYPLNNFYSSFLQPFFYLEADLGIGSYKKITRTDFGHNIGVGLDIGLYKSYGLSLLIESHQAAENSLRILLGFFSENFL
jgi:hypothetical protein